MRRTRWIPYAAVTLAAIILYLPTVRFEYVLDDLHLIVNNTFLREPWSPLTAFAHHFWHGTIFQEAYYRPIVTSSFALNGLVFGWGPAGFHLVNVLLHALNAALVLALARRLGNPVWAAACAALLFALHPAAAWPVGSIVARVDLLPGLFVLLAWLAWTAPPSSQARQAAVAFFFLLAILSKETGLAFLSVPLLALRRKDQWRARRPVLASLAAALAGCLVLRRVVGIPALLSRGLIDPLINPLATLPAAERVRAALALSGRYLLYLVAPVRFSDPRNYFDAASIPPLLSPDVILPLLVLLGWGAGVAILWLRHDRVAIPLAFGLASFLPASNIFFPITSLYALNFLYLPLIGLSLATGEWLGRISPRARFAVSRQDGQTVLELPKSVLFLTPLLGALALTSHIEVGIWRNAVSLFTAWTERFPNYPPAQSSLGVALLDQHEPAVTGQDRASWIEALEHLRRSMELAPTFAAPAKVNASKALLLLDRPDEAEAEAREGLQLSPDLMPARVNSAQSLYRQSRYGDAADQFAELVRSNPTDVSVRSNYVVSLIHAGELDRAHSAASAAQRAFPGAAWFDFCLARVEALRGHGSKALALL
ncbi:MAG: hypothetical protein DMF51_03225, partial [Acidobacteria bacterium]